MHECSQDLARAARGRRDLQATPGTAVPTGTQPPPPTPDAGRHNYDHAAKHSDSAEAGETKYYGNRQYLMSISSNLTGA